MNLNEYIISKSEFLNLNASQYISLQELYRMASYPSISLIKYCEKSGPVSSWDKILIKEIEDNNIYHFLRTLILLFGLGSKEEQSKFNEFFTKEPLRTAVILGQFQNSSKEKFIVFMENAIRIMLSPNSKDQFFLDPINPKIQGSMPKIFFKSRQNIGDMWFNEFIETKLILFRKACLVLSEEDVFPIMLRSLAYSLYNFTPPRYNISMCNDENEAIKIILRDFLNKIQFYKK